jgi:hypothetical protein
MPAPENPAASFAWIARYVMMKAKAHVGEAERWCEAHRAPERVLRVIKTGVPGAGTLTPAWAGNAIDYNGAVAAFFESLRTSSVFFRLLADGAFRRTPLRSRVTSFTAPVGYVAGEGKPVPSSAMALSTGILEAVRAAAEIVLLDELVKNVSSAGQIAFNNELKNAVAQAVDAEFFNLVFDSSTDGSTTVESAGADNDDFFSDLRRAMLAVGSGGNSKLYWIAGVNTAKRAASLGPNVAPAMSAMGGELLNLPALVSSAIATDSLYLVDASRIAADAGTIQLQASANASIQMSDTPTPQDAGTGVEAMLVSMFQIGAVALRATCEFGAEPIAPDVVSVVTGVEWGGEVTA